MYVDIVNILQMIIDSKPISSNQACFGSTLQAIYQILQIERFRSSDHAASEYVFALFPELRKYWRFLYSFSYASQLVPLMIFYSFLSVQFHALWVADSPLLETLATICELPSRQPALTALERESRALSIAVAASLAEILMVAELGV